LDDPVEYLAPPAYRREPTNADNHASPARPRDLRVTVVTKIKANEVSTIIVICADGA
jgi:hypothetical protein